MILLFLFIVEFFITLIHTQLTYSSVVMRDSIRIAILIAALNDIEILAADIGNAYLQAPVREKSILRLDQSLGQTILERQ
jgi:hypothetical protein